MFYTIGETIVPAEISLAANKEKQFIAVLTPEEWSREKESFDMGIDLEPDIPEIHTSHAVENFDSVTGAFCIPDRTDFWNEFKFAFALDEKGIVFIDDNGEAEKMIESIRCGKKYRFPCLERFLYDFFDQMIRDDLRIMESYESELNDMETSITAGDEGFTENRLNDIRGNIRDLMTHYEQLLDMSEVLEENENHFFSEENLRYFRMISGRVERLRDRASSVRDYTIQIRELYRSHLETKQNRIMSMLTVVTTVFMPLTLIAGWFGMNFKYMPELEYRYSYPVVIVISAAIVIGSIIFFKKKKLL